MSKKGTEMPKGFHIRKSEKDIIKDTFKSKENPSNRDIMDMLQLILDKLDQ